MPRAATPRVPEFAPRPFRIDGPSASSRFANRTRGLDRIVHAMSDDDQHVAAAATLVIDGGDLACGELLMLVFRRIRHQAPGTMVVITTSDPAAPIDIPAWCHLTGHRYHGVSTDRPHDTYLVELSGVARQVDPDSPWRPTPQTDNTSAQLNLAPTSSAPTNSAPTNSAPINSAPINSAKATS